MTTHIKYSIVVPVFNEAYRIESALRSLYEQSDEEGSPLPKDFYEVIIAHSPSTDGTKEMILGFQNAHSDFNIKIVDVAQRGLVPALIAGMNRSIDDHLFERSSDKGPILISTHADCIHRVDWLYQLVTTLERSHATLACSSCYYEEDDFTSRPHLWRLIKRTMDARDFINRITGGLPEGRGYAIYASDYLDAGGLKEFYQVSNGTFVDHCSDDMDFCTELRALGKNIVFSERSKVKVDSRRIDSNVGLMIQGLTYGKDGILELTHVRDQYKRHSLEDLCEEELESLQDFTNKDFVLKYVVLPLFLSPQLFEAREMMAFLGGELAKDLSRRIHELKSEEGFPNYRMMHSWRTACYRLYFEFASSIFARCREKIDPDFGNVPEFPMTLKQVPKLKSRLSMRDFYYFYAEDRESGEVHNYFGNGGVF